MYSRSHRPLVVCTVLLIALAVAVVHIGADGGSGSGSVAIPDGTAIVQNFDTLSNSTSPSNTLPTGWYLTEIGTGAAADGKYVVGTGSGTAGGAYSFGATNAADRALGSLGSGTVTPIHYGAQLTNTGTSAISSLAITYDGELWRRGPSTAADGLTFAYSTSATSLATGTFVSVPGLNFTSPGNSCATTGTPTDGNSAACRTTISGTITGLSLNPNASIWIRWTDTDTTGSDDGVAIDNVNITASFGTGGTTNPSITGTNATPSPVDPTASSLLTATVSQGANAIQSVTADLSAIGGSKFQQLYDDGINGGDLTPGDAIYSFRATVPMGTSGGTKLLPVTVTDTASKTGTGNISLGVNTFTSPTGSLGQATPSSVTAGQSTSLTLSVTVGPGTHPASTNLAASVDLSSIGGSVTTLQPNGNVFKTTTTVSVPAGTMAGNKSLPVSITDDQGRSGSTAIALTVTTPGPSVVGTTPAIGATNVLVGSNVVINFNRPVNATASAFTIQCPAGASLTFAQSASPAAITLTPSAPLPASQSCVVTIDGSQVTDSDSTPMSSSASFSFSTAPAAAGTVLINEIDADTPGSPMDTAEFIELYGPPNTPLDGLSVVLYDGGLSTDSPAFGGKQSYAAFDLQGYSTDANGYFVLGNPGVSSAQLIFDPGQFGLLQNGPDAVALYVGHAANNFGFPNDFPNGTIVTTTNLLDAIVYGTDDPAPANLLPLVKSGGFIVNEDANGNGPNESSQRCPNGAGATRDDSAYIQGAPTPGGPNACPAQQPPSSIVISQIYGAGGNSASSPYTNDYVELFNRGASPVNVDAWTLQYASAVGNGWSGETQPLAGVIKPGEYYLIALASGGTCGGTTNCAPLPTPNVSSSINISATGGKIALVDNLDPLAGNCPLINPHLRDFVGYGSTSSGTTDCGEGQADAPAPSTTTAIFRQGGGSIDTNNNQGDFVTGTPFPRQTSTITPLGPYVFFTDPNGNRADEPRDPTIEVKFTVPVAAAANWFNISCTATGQHNDATIATFGGLNIDYYITPNKTFQAGESCTVTVDHTKVTQSVQGQPAVTLPSDYVFGFTVATGNAAPEPPEVHLTMGNPTGATADVNQPDNYLMEKPEYALSYNKDLGRPNWVSWHLTNDWIGAGLTRVDTFRADPAVPPDWYRVESFDFVSSGFDRGHTAPNADRESSTPTNQATFLMSNMMAQAPDNNQGPWVDLENYLRTFLPANEVYIVAGSVGTGGTGSNGGVTNTLAAGHVTVPASTWKVALVLPKMDGDDIARVNCSTRTIAVIMPNMQGIVGNQWEMYQKRVGDVEQLVRTDTTGGFTGFTLFSNLPAPIRYCLKTGLLNDQTITFGSIAPHAAGDADFPLAATASSGLPITYAVTSGPATIVAGDMVRITGPGTVTIKASQAGDVNYNAAPDVSQSFAVTKGSQSIVFAPLADRTYGDASFTVSATGGGSSNPVTFAAAGSCTASGTNGTTVTLTSAGTCTITASQAGDANYDPATSVPQMFNIARRNAGIAVNGYTGVYDGAAHGATGTAVGINNEDLSSLLHLGATFTDVPGGTAHWTFDGSAIYAAAAGDVNITISKAMPALSSLSALTIEAGATTTTIGGTIRAGSLVPPGSVTITVGAANVAAAIGATGQFSASVPTGTLSPAGSPYPIAFAYAGGTDFDTAAAASSLTVQDTTPPVLTLPANISTNSASASGTVVTFTATATDAVDGPRPVLCTPASGSTFPIGTTAVSCTSSDTSGNTATGRFTATVNPTGSVTVNAGQSVAFSNGSIGGNVTVNGGTLVLDGGTTVHGNLEASAGSNVTISGAAFVGGNVQLTGNGRFAMPNGTVGGNLQITGAASFSIGAGSTVGGNLQITGLQAGGATSTLCGTAVHGNVQLTGSAAPVTLGDAPGCAGNTIGGNLQATSNASVRLFSNQIQGSLQCNGNTSIAGGGNAAKSKQGQCAGF